MGDEPLLKLFGRADLFPSDYPPIIGRGVGYEGPLTDKEIAEAAWALDDQAKQEGERHQISALIAISQIFPISYETWMEMDDLMKRAIALEVEEIARKRESAKKDRERKMEMQLAEEASKVKFPVNPPSTIGRFFE